VEDVTMLEWFGFQAAVATSLWMTWPMVLARAPIIFLKLVAPPPSRRLLGPPAR
jgi:hypothetical protein